MNVIVPFAEGLEEIEAVTIVDVLRRADINVTSTYINKNPVIGSHNISLIADKGINMVRSDDFNCMILPGGLPGSENLKKNNTILNFLKQIHSNGGIIAAICAAPIVLGQAGILKGRKATCYPGFEGELKGASIVDKPVVADGNVITARGPGCAVPFALEVVGRLKDKETMIDLKKRMQVYWM